MKITFLKRDSPFVDLTRSGANILSRPQFQKF